MSSANAHDSARAARGVGENEFLDPDALKIADRTQAGLFEGLRREQNGEASYKGVRLSMETDPRLLLGVVADLLNRKHYDDRHRRNLESALMREAVRPSWLPRAPAEWLRDGMIITVSISVGFLLAGW